MGGLYGWNGARLELDESRQVIDAMRRDCGDPQGSANNSISNDTAATTICAGIHATNFSVQDGIWAAIVGSPHWDNKRLSDLGKDRSLAVSLIKAYRDQGRNLLNRLHGPFALAILDGDEAFIAIDRIGIHSLSYALKDGVFVFGTSISSVAGHPKIGRNVDPQAIFNYFYFHDIPAPGTIYQGVEKLLPAQYIHFRNGDIEKGFYWRLHYNDYDQASFQNEKQRFFELMRTSMGSNRDGRSTATFLSGGTDSSTVTGIFSEIASEPVDSYSIGFSADGFDEMEYARLAAERFGATLHEYYLKPEDIIEAIPLISRAYDEPFGNDSAVPTYFCAKLAAEDGVKVMLAGDGGDEIFGGNARYAKQMVFEHYARVPEFLRSRLVEPLAFGLPGGDALLPVRKLKSYIRQAKIPLPERMESYNFIHRHPLEEIFESEFLSLVNPEVPEALLRDAYFRADSKHPINRMLHLDLKFTLADNDLRKVSRMCEMVGIEVRYPILDERLVEFSAGLPPSFKIRGQKLRWFFKEALKEFLPSEIIHKSKHGFGLPFGVWALSHPELKALVDETLVRFGDRGYMQPEYIRSLRRLHAEEHPTYYGKMIWVMVMLEQWLELHRASHEPRNQPG